MLFNISIDLQCISVYFGEPHNQSIISHRVFFNEGWEDCAETGDTSRLVPVTPLSEGR